MMKSWQTLDLLTQLIDKSLVIYDKDDSGRGRYRIQESLRQYGRDRLRESGESETTRDRHQLHFCQHSQLVQEKLTSSESRTWLSGLEADYDNVRAALEWFPVGAASVQTRRALELAAYLTGFWQLRGYISEARAHLQQILAATANDSEAIGLRRDGLIGAGVLALMQGDLVAAEAFLAECRELCRERNDPYGEGRSLWLMGNVENHKGNLDTGRECYEKALALFEKIGDLSGIASITTNLGCLAMARKDYGAAKAMFEQAIASAEQSGNRDVVAQGLHNLGYLAYLQADWQTSRRFYERSLRLARDRGNKQGIAITSGSLANTLTRLGDFVASHKAMRESLELSQTFGDRPYIALLLEAAADLAVSQSHFVRAARLSGAAEALRELLGIPVPPDEQADNHRTQTAIRHGLPEPDFQTAWNAGRKMDWNEAAEYTAGETK